MTTSTKTVELAVQTSDGTWEHIGDYATEDEAVEAAQEWAARAWRDNRGVAVFGISADPLSGHYETRVEVDEDGEYTVQ